MEEIDIWRVANLLVNRHGGDAEILAVQRANALLNHGDIDGQRVWLRVVKAILELRRTRPTPDEQAN